MKKIIVHLVCVFCALLIMSCNQAEHDKESHQKTDESETTEATEEHAHSDTELTLNNGELWQANPETTEGVDNMIQLVDAFSDTENVESYAALSEELKNEFGLVFKRCTMKGEAHNQLHNFLIPINAQFKNLESNDLNQCKDAFSELKSHLAIYKDFFD